jgi:hypothetical protein
MPQPNMKAEKILFSAVPVALVWMYKLMFVSRPILASRSRIREFMPGLLWVAL